MQPCCSFSRMTHDFHDSIGTFCKECWKHCLVRTLFRLKCQTNVEVTDTVNNTFDRQDIWAQSPSSIPFDIFRIIIYIDVPSHVMHFTGDCQWSCRIRVFNIQAVFMVNLNLINISILLNVFNLEDHHDLILLENFPLRKEISVPAESSSARPAIFISVNTM